MDNDYTLKFGNKLRLTIDNDYHGYCFTIRKGSKPLARSISFPTRGSAWEAALEFLELYNDMVDYLVDGKFEVWIEDDDEK